MRKLLHYLFPLLALVVCVARPSRAEAPQLAVCKNGMCVMSEVDYKNLQALTIRMLHAAEQAQMDASRQEHRADSCVAFLKNHHA